MITLLPKRLPWMSQGLCIETGNRVFFPPKGASAAPAKAICADCPVVQECALYALDDYGLDGVWGGMTVGERDRIRSHSPHVAAGNPSENVDLADESYPDTWMELLPDSDMAEVQFYPALKSNPRLQTRVPNHAENLAADAEKCLAERKAWLRLMDLAAEVLGDELFAEDVDLVEASA
jgi:WhiB family transcriptional regulator, redox-sensing transcriptional regulator